MTNQPMDGTEYPPELVAKPLALIGIAGLDTINNAVHKSIWDVFGNNRRPDRAPVHFKLIPNDHKFPVIKPKRNSYEWYIPKGILKKNWLNKHLNLIPAVIVVFYDMDWNDIQWNEKIIECASRVQSMRAITSMHSPKIVVVVIQNTAPLPSSDDIIGDERAQQLCAACEIQSKSLLVLPYRDHLIEYAIRLENAFYDLAQQYYHHEIRNIKSHREHLNKTTHQYLFVRHQFKIGFICELKQDMNTAHKHYLNAYNSLSEVRIVDANALEVKTVAGYINFKLCRLLFNLNQQRNAITQLRSHTEKYSRHVGIKELAFEHHAWMARQYSTFGELFNEAIRSGLSATQTQHPGFYFQVAAKCATERRKACHLLCADILAYPQPDPLQGTVDFYGQYVWRAGKLSTDLSDPQRERDAIRALQYNELHNVNHSMLIINLLGNANSQYKTYRCPRMRRHLLVQMAHEYYTCADYDRALTLYTHMLWDYRKEKWWYIVSLIIEKALSCAYLTANVQDYITLSMEALGKNINMNCDKMRIFNNLLAVINDEVPQPEPNITENLIQNAISNWNSSSNVDTQNMEVDMSLLTSFIETKARFTEQKYQVDCSVMIELFIRVTAPGPFEIQQVNLCVNNFEIIVCERETTSSLYFEDDSVRKYICEFVPEPQDVGKSLQISSILLKIGTPNKRYITLKFNGAGSLVSELFPEIFHYRAINKDIPNFDSIQPVATAQIIPRESKMTVTIEQEDPALLGEWFPITINVINDEHTDAHHIQLSLNLFPVDLLNSDPIAELCFEIGNEISQLPLLLSIGTLNRGSVFKKTFFIRSNKVISTTILMKITYDINTFSNNQNDGENIDKKKMACFKEHSIKVTVVKPFEISTKYLSMKFKEIENCFNDEPFIFMPEIKVLSPWPIIIENTTLEILEPFAMVDEEATNCLNGLTIEENVIANEAICVKSKRCPENQLSNLGLYTISWRRLSKKSVNSTKTSIMISGPNVSSSWLQIETIAPAHGYLRSPLPFKLRFYSSAMYPYSLSLKVDASNAFMFSGHRQCTITLLPDSMREFVFNFYPLVCGAVTPPKFQLSPLDIVSTPTTPEQPLSNVSLVYLQELIDRSIPTQIFIMPQEKLDPYIEKKMSSLKINS